MLQERSWRAIEREGPAWIGIEPSVFLAWRRGWGGRVGEGACNDANYLHGVYSAVQQNLIKNVSGNVFWSGERDGDCSSVLWLVKIFSDKRVMALTIIAPLAYQIHDMVLCNSAAYWQWLVVNGVTLVSAFQKRWNDVRIVSCMMR